MSLPLYQIDVPAIVSNHWRDSYLRDFPVLRPVPRAKRYDRSGKKMLHTETGSPGTQHKHLRLHDDFQRALTQFHNPTSLVFKSARINAADRTQKLPETDVSFFCALAGTFA